MGNEEKYVGRTYRFDAKGDAVNCCSLAREFYSDHGWKQNWDDGIPWPKRPAGYEGRLKSYMAKEFQSCGIDDLQYGDIVMLNQRAGGGIGVYVGEGRLLCLERPFRDGQSKTVIYPEKKWKPYAESGYKR